MALKDELTDMSRAYWVDGHIEVTPKPDELDMNAASESAYRNVLEKIAAWLDRPLFTLALKSDELDGFVPLPPVKAPAKKEIPVFPARAMRGFRY